MNIQKEEYIRTKRYNIIKKNSFLLHKILDSDNINVKRWNGTGYDFNGKETYQLEQGKGILEIHYVELINDLNI